MVASATVDRVPLAGVGSNCVEAYLTREARSRLAQTLIDVNAVPKSVLDVSNPTLDPRLTAERALSVLTLKLWTAIMCTCLTLVNIFAVVVVCELIARATADLSLAAEGTICIDAALSPAAVMRAKQTLIDIFTVLPIRFESVAFEASTSAIAHTLVGTLLCSFALVVQLSLISVGICLILFVRGLDVLGVWGSVRAAGPGHQATLVAQRQAVIAG